MTNATLTKFGYPQTLLKELEHWCILLRPAQATLGALVLGAKSGETALSRLPQAAFTEMHAATSMIERTLAEFRPNQRINYLALMMVDPHVHFHVLPRYNATQVFAGTEFPDPGFPGPPDLKSAVQPEKQVFESLHKALVDLFAGAV